MHNSTELRNDFHDLAATVANNNRILPENILIHPEARAIIQMGRIAVPLILSGLEEEPNPLCWALKHILKEQPYNVTKEDNFNYVSNSWLNWGVSKRDATVNGLLTFIRTELTLMPYESQANDNMIRIYFKQNDYTMKIEVYNTLEAVGLVEKDGHILYVTDLDTKIEIYTLLHRFEGNEILQKEIHE